MAEISETLIEDCVKSFTVLSSRVAVLSDSVNQMKEKQKNMDIKLDKISCVLLKKSDYFTVGEIALKEGVSEKTVLRRIKMGVIPYEKSEGEKAYRIPSIKYNESISHDGVSMWFQDHT